MSLLGGDYCRRVWERVTRLWTQHEIKIGFSTITSSRKAPASIRNDVQVVARSRQGEAGNRCSSGSHWSKRVCLPHGPVVRRFASQGGATGKIPGGVCLIRYLWCLCRP